MTKKCTILVVDDDQGMRETLSDIFSEMGHDTAVAGDGYDAIKLVRERPYDLVLIDIKMPGMNGVETFRRIKEVRPGLKVVMMTAFALDELIEEARSLGAVEVLFKPLQLDKLEPFLTLA